MKEGYNERSELLSELYTIKNQLLGELMEVDMAIMREKNAFDAKRARTVTQQTKEVLRKLQGPPRPLWAADGYQRQAMEQSDAKQLQTEPPYKNLLQ